MWPKLDSDHDTVTVKKGKYSALFRSTPSPSLGLVASLAASGFCFLKAGFCLKEAPSPFEGFSARLGSQQAEPSWARGGQHIPLAHRQAFSELQYKKPAPVVRISWCGTVRYVHEFSEVGAVRSLAFFKICFVGIQVCWWTVQPSVSSMLLKAFSCLCLTALGFFPLFHAMSTPVLHLIPSTQKQTVPMCRPYKTHCGTSRVKVLPQMFATEISDVCEQVWRQTVAQFGFASSPKSTSLVFLLNGRVCSASRLMQCFPWLGRCI